MTLTVNTSAENPYKKFHQYQKTEKIYEFTYKGERYYKKVTYEAQLHLCYRIGVGILAALGTLLILPFCCNSQQVTLMWNQAISGVDKKVILIKNHVEKERVLPQPVAKKQVQFGEAHARIFNKKQAPAVVAMTSSMNLGPLARPQQEHKDG